MRLLINVGLLLFLGFSGLLVFAYFGLLWEKIVRPQYKNMNAEQAIWGGIIAIALLGIDVMIVRRFFRKYNRRLRI